MQSGNGIPISLGVHCTFHIGYVREGVVILINYTQHIVKVQDIETLEQFKMKPKDIFIKELPR